MQKPDRICDECFEKNRIAHDIREGAYLVGTYCTHAGTGAIAEQRGDDMSEWQFNTADERGFWHMLRLSARFVRGEITEAQLRREIFQSAKANSSRKPGKRRY